MKRESVAFAVSGTFFGVLVGWILGSQQNGPGRAPAGAPPAAMSSGVPGSPTPQPQAPPLDVRRAAALQKTANEQPANASVRVELANLYYDAQQFDQAIPWYEAALKINPKDINASTDLAVSYHYSGDTDRALAQIDKSLALDARSTSALLNQGYIRAFGKQDLAGAAESWQKVIDIAPTSAEAARARQGLDAIKGNHAPASGRGGSPPPADPR